MQRHNKKACAQAAHWAQILFTSKAVILLSWKGSVLAQLGMHIHTQRCSWWLVTWSHTAETTLAVTQTLTFAPTVSVGLAGPRARPPALLSQESCWAWPCSDTTHTHTHNYTNTISNCSFCLQPLHLRPLVNQKKNAEGHNWSFVCQFCFKIEGR